MELATDELLMMVSVSIFADGYSPDEIDYVQGSSGSASYSHIGNSSFGSDGSSYTRIGETTFSNNADSYDSSNRNIGDAAFDSSATRIGDSTFSNSGSCTKIGSTAFCD